MSKVKVKSHEKKTTKYSSNGLLPENRPKFSNKVFVHFHLEVKTKSTGKVLSPSTTASRPGSRKLGHDPRHAAKREGCKQRGEGGAWGVPQKTKPAL